MFDTNKLLYFRETIQYAQFITVTPVSSIQPFSWIRTKN